MPDPDVSNRERLLRLIDGGPEVVKEVQEERAKSGEIKPIPVVPAPEKTETAPDERPWTAHADVLKLVKIGIVGVLVIFGIHSVSNLVSSLKTRTKTPVNAEEKAVAAAVAIEEAAEGTGLRLVGVDWGEPPVALLEDLVTGKTYFARQNERIKGSRVRQIFKDKVIVSFRGKTVELRS